MSKELFESHERVVGHKCALAGVVLESPDSEICRLVAGGLDGQQHRGEEAAGIAWGEGGMIKVEKQLGLRQTALPDSVISRLASGRVAIGHTRYSTAGNSSVINAQPFTFDGRHQFALAHNGNIGEAGVPAPGDPTSDTHLVGKAIAQGGRSLVENTIEVLGRLNGAYVFLFLTPEALYVARDPWGFRPCVEGPLRSGLAGTAVASETVGLDGIGADYRSSIPRGCLAQIHSDGVEVIWQDPRVDEFGEAACSFEKAYFADASSLVEVAGYGLVSVHEVRVLLGRKLAWRNNCRGDFVVPIPNSGWSYAEGVALQTGLPIRQAIHANRYRGRNFIKPQSKEERRLAALGKYRFIPKLINGRELIVVDDSIIRGHTCQGVILELLRLGAKRIELLSGIPPVVAPCFWGIDFPELKQLIHYQMGQKPKGNNFEEALASWLVGGDEQLVKRLRVSFQKMEDYVGTMQNVAYHEAGIAGSGGCFHCVSRVVPTGAVADYNMTKTRFEPE